MGLIQSAGGGNFSFRTGFEFKEAVQTQKSLKKNPEAFDKYSKAGIFLEFGAVPADDQLSKFDQANWMERTKSGSNPLSKIFNKLEERFLKPRYELILLSLRLAAKF